MVAVCLQQGSTMPCRPRESGSVGFCPSGRDAFRRYGILALLFAACVVSEPAFAQGTPSPSGGSSDGHKLDLGAALFASYTDNVLADLAGGGGDTASPVGLRGRGDQNAGIYTGLTANLNYGYTKRKGPSSFIANARSNGSYYPDLDIRSLQHMVDMTVSRQFGRRTNARFSQSARVADQYRLELFPDHASNDPTAVLSLADEFAVIARRTYAYVTSTGLSHQLSSRATLGVNYGLRQVVSPDLDFNFMSHNASASFHYQLTRYGGVRASYSYREATRDAAQQAQPPLQSHDVGLGIDYNRAFSLSGRRTSLTFTTGSSLVATGREEEQGDQTTVSSNLRPVLQGSVTLRRNLGRTWDAQAGYRRLVHFIEGFTHPMFTEAVSAGITGEVGKHIKANALIAHAFGNEGRSRAPGRSYGTKLASVHFGYPLLSQLDVFAQYFFFRQQLGENMTLPQGVAHSLNRHSVRVGLSFRLPVI